MQNICLGCGLCCDGTIYPHVTLAGDSARTRVPVLLARIEYVEGNARLPLPCAACHDGACSVYVDRPEPCRDYLCILRQKFDAGSVSAETAQSLIATALGLRDKVRAGTASWGGADGTLPLAESFRRMVAASGAGSGTSHLDEGQASLLLDMAALEILLARHFKGGGRDVFGTPRPPEK